MEHKTFRIDIQGMAHIGPHKYAEAIDKHIYFISANKYEIIRYNYLNKTTDTIISYNPKNWVNLSKKDINKINKALPGANALKELNKTLPRKNIIHGLEIINDSTIFVRHLSDYYGKNMDFFVDIWIEKHNKWEISNSNLAYKKPCNPSINISKENFPIYLYKSFFFNKDGLFFTITNNETELSPIGYNFEEFHEVNQNILSTNKPVYKLNIFHRK
ncbi:MAG: hypothetical protein RBS19_11525 [Bacteroidales bacterium]|nr:hypothetical protein [Bacteroidales bacterium]